MIFIDFGQLVQGSRAALQDNAVAQNNAIRQNQIDNVIPYQTDLQQQLIGQQAQLVPGQTQIALGQQDQTLWTQGQTVNARPATEATNNYNNALTLGRAANNQQNLGGLLTGELGAGQVANADAANANRLGLGRAAIVADNVDRTLGIERGAAGVTATQQENANAVGQGVATAGSDLIGQRIQAGADAERTKLLTDQRTNELTLGLINNRDRLQGLTDLSSVLAPNSGATDAYKEQAIQKAYPGATVIKDTTTGTLFVQGGDGQPIPMDALLKADTISVQNQTAQIIGELSPPSSAERVAQINAQGRIEAAKQRSSGNAQIDNLFGDKNLSDITSQIPGSANYGQQPAAPAAAPAPAPVYTNIAGQPVEVPNQAPAQAPAEPNPAAPIARTPIAPEASQDRINQFDLEITTLKPQVAKAATDMADLTRQIDDLKKKAGSIMNSAERDPAAKTIAFNQVRTDILTLTSQLSTLRAQHGVGQSRLSQLEQAADQSRRALKLTQGN